MAEHITAMSSSFLGPAVRLQPDSLHNHHLVDDLYRVPSGTSANPGWELVAVLPELNRLDEPLWEIVRKVNEWIPEEEESSATNDGVRMALGEVRTHNGAPVSAENLRWAATHEALCRSFIFDVLMALADHIEETPNEERPQ